jgi:hypothetical protein
MAGGTSDAPSLVPIDSVRLAEDDNRYVGQAIAMAIAPSGAFFITDNFAKQVHAFGRGGRYLRAVGRRGQGPGELEAPEYLAFDGDSLLYVIDRSEIEMFDSRSATHLGASAMRERPGPVAVSSGRLFAGHADSAQGGSVATITIGSPDLRVSGPFPFAEFMLRPGLFPLINSVALALNGDTVATSYSVTNAVYLSDVAGRVLDSIPVPVQRRQGAHPDLIRRFAENPSDQELGERVLYGASFPAGLHWLPGGKVVVVSTDWKRLENRSIEAVYLSVADPKTRRSCVDARIPGPTDPPVRVAMRGDTLFVLSQETDGETRISTTIRSYRIDTSACRWVAG